jgi:hypothetical protein
LCDQAGQIGESGALGWGGWGAGRGYSETPLWQLPPVSIKDCAVLASVSKFRIVLTARRAFMGSDKLSSLVTTLSNHTSLLQGVFMEGE